MPIQVYELCFALGICFFFIFFGSSILDWCEKKYKEWNENLTMTLLLFAGSLTCFILSAHSKSMVDCVFMSFLGALCFCVSVWAFIRQSDFAEKKRINDDLTRRAREEAEKKERAECELWGKRAKLFAEELLESHTK